MSTPQHMFLWRNGENYHRIITKYPAEQAFWKTKQNKTKKKKKKISSGFNSASF